MAFIFQNILNKVLLLIFLLSVKSIKCDENETESDLVWILDGIETRFGDRHYNESSAKFKSHLSHQNYDQMRPLAQSASDEEDDYEEEVANYDQSSADGKCLGTCVPSYECDDDQEDGVGVIDPRKKKYSKCPPGQVCCSHEVGNQEYQKCGISPSDNTQNRILSTNLNSESEFAEFPWMAIVLKFQESINKYVCGAVLIDNFHVLTCAHCVLGLRKRDLKIRLGEWNTQTTNEVYLHKDFSVEKILIHPEFSNKSLHNDIAIIKLSSEVKFEYHIRSVCLPKQSQSFEDQWCVTTGWGKNAFEGGKYANIMKEVTVPIVKSDLCQDVLRQTRLGQHFRLHSSFICAGGQEGRDSCKGDGGGPLVCLQKDGSYFLAGLVSWGIECGSPGIPGIYVNVAELMPYISQKTGIPLN